MWWYNILYQNNNIVAHNLLFHITLYSHVDAQNSKKTRQRVCEKNIIPQSSYKHVGHCIDFLFQIKT